MALTEAVHPDMTAFVGGGEDRDSVELLVKGARCATCMGKIEAAAFALPGVTDARLNLTSGRLTVAWRKGLADIDAVVQALGDLGYPATPFDPQSALQEDDRQGRRLALALGVAGFGVGNVMMFSIPAWSGLFGQEMGVGGRTTMYWLSALIATPCALYAGTPFFTSAWAVTTRPGAGLNFSNSLPSVTLKMRTSPSNVPVARSFAASL